jgi:homoserine kinase type II
MSQTCAPTLEMLWEGHDPTDALATRFGFSDAAAASRWVVTTLDEHWGVRVDSCERIVMSDCNALAWVRTPPGRLLAKWSVAPERFPRLAALARLTTWLASEGLPVSAPVAALDGRLQVEVDGVSLSLQREVVADLLDTTVPDQVRAAGAVLARLHDALATYAHAELERELVTPSAPLAAQVTEWLETSAAHVPVTAREVLDRLVAGMPPDPLPTQLVHGDFRSANVLCVGADVAAVIDFEESRLDHRIIELARSAVLLGTRFHHWAPASSEVRTAFLDGYESERRLTPLEARWWDVLVLWYSLAMIPPGDDPTGWESAALSYLRDLGQEA